MWGDSDHIKRLKDAEFEAVGKMPIEPEKQLKHLKAAERAIEKQARAERKAEDRAAKAIAKAEKWEAMQEWEARKADALAEKRARKEAARAEKWELQAAKAEKWAAVDGGKDWKATEKWDPPAVQYKRVVSYVEVPEDTRGGCGCGAPLILIIVLLAALAMIMIAAGIP